ncbi:uncharacterized protein LOC141586110 isoform X2 [Silene latifolia]|uniref:uncharacterized protein LOC141586110 isoform X2 n=1 Tax=Silene latifolia TaxID=37657 RepID=UPI003D7731F6
MHMFRVEWYPVVSRLLKQAKGLVHQYMNIYLFPGWQFLLIFCFAVDLPPWFSSLSLALESDVDLTPREVEKISKEKLPLVCFRDGSLPLPDFPKNAVDHLDLSYFSNETVRTIEGREDAERCYPLQKQIFLKLTNEQITPGVWFVGVFNGVGAMRTQAKMVSRGTPVSFSANVSVEGCVLANLWGQFCNQSITALSCSESHSNYNSPSDSSIRVVDDVACRSSVQDSCLGNNNTIVYSLEVIGTPDHMSISATDINLNGTVKVGQYGLMSYARYGAIALAAIHDYSGDLSKGPLVIPLPKMGTWYITILLFNTTKGLDGLQDNSATVCYSLDWQVSKCPFGKAGPNCSSNLYTLQTVPRQNPFPFESYYVPPDGDVRSGNFPLEPLLTNSSLEGMLGETWTYFVLDIPRGAAGGNLHFKLISDKKVGFEIYLRYGSLPSVNVRDYYYINSTNNSDGTSFFDLSNSTKNPVDFYILYAQEGTWSFGLKHLYSTDTAPFEQAKMSVSLERCPKGCSGHGSCQNFVDESGLTIYSFCTCDKTHGGIDCSIELVTQQGHKWQSISLIASNAAAILPAYWALRKKAYAEWVIYTSSGISSALYHACDVGAWCVLKFTVLQFMDFWLSFMAVISTFVYLTAIDEASKRTIHAALSILTALMAITGATRSANLWLVIVIGATGLLIGWLIEFSTKYRSLSFSTGFCLSALYSWDTIRTSLHNVIKLLRERFRWGFMLGGFIALSMAAISWKLETSINYWIWHSIWHVSIYTSSFLFLCSKVIPSTTNTDNQRPQTGNYELSRQDSISHSV